MFSQLKSGVTAIVRTPPPFAHFVGIGVGSTTSKVPLPTAAWHLTGSWPGSLSAFARQDATTGPFNDPSES